MLIGTEPLDLRLTLVDSAQCFHWFAAGGRFGCALDGGPVWLRRRRRASRPRANSTRRRCGTTWTWTGTMPPWPMSTPTFPPPARPSGCSRGCGC